MNFLKKALGFEQPDYYELIENGALIIDVRTAAEFAQGHAEGSMNIPLNEIRDHISTIQETGRSVITCCRSGGRAGMANGILKTSGISAYNAGSWENMQSILDKNK